MASIQGLQVRNIREDVKNDMEHQKTVPLSSRFYQVFPPKHGLLVRNMHPRRICITRNLDSKAPKAELGGRHGLWVACCGKQVINMLTLQRQVSSTGMDPV